MNGRFWLLNPARLLLALAVGVFAWTEAFAQAPLITARPGTKLGILGQSVSFSVAATSATPLSYQWKCNGTTIAGATDATYQIPAVRRVDGGHYQVIVSNAAGSALSVCHLNVASPNATAVRWTAYRADFPAGYDRLAMAAPRHAFVGLTTSGTVIGTGIFGSMPPPPDGLGTVVAISAAAGKAAAVKGDGTLALWNSYYATTYPSALKQAVAVAIGDSLSVGLDADGSVVAWAGGLNGQTEVPAEASPAVAVAASGSIGLALRTDGRVVAWGSDGIVDTGRTRVPAGLDNVMAIAISADHGVALKKDGTVVTWGGEAGRNTVPAGLTDVVAISAGFQSTLALRSDGTVVGWGGGSATGKPMGSGRYTLEGRSSWPPGRAASRGAERERKPC